MASGDARRVIDDAAYGIPMGPTEVVTGVPGDELVLCMFGGGRPNLFRTG